MGLLSGDGPKLNTVALDPATQALIGDMQHRATASDADIANVANHGITERGLNMMEGDQQALQANASSAQDPNMTQAIRNQYQAAAGKGIQTIVNKNKMNAPLHRGALLDQSSMMSSAAGQVATNNYQALTQANLDYEQARAQALNSILTSVGMGVGMVMGNQKKPTERPNTPSDSTIENHAGQSFDNVGGGSMDRFFGGQRNG